MILEWYIVRSWFRAYSYAFWKKSKQIIRRKMKKSKEIMGLAGCFLPCVLPWLGICFLGFLQNLQFFWNLRIFQILRKSEALQKIHPPPREIIPPTPPKYSPRNIQHARARLLQIAANWCLRGCCEMLKRFGFRLEMYYLCTRKRRKPKTSGFSPLFLT